MELKDKKILVVGVGKGLGPATVYLLLKHGAEVVMASRTLDRLELLKSELSVYGRLSFVVSDASTPEGANYIISEAIKQLGQIDGLVILVGNYTDTPIDMLDEHGLNEMINANLKGPLYLIKSSLQYLKNGSSIVMISSTLGTYATGIGNVAYSSTKAGVAKATEVLASELIPRGIRVNSVAPKSMRHDFVPGRDWKTYRKLGDSECPPEDVAVVIAWLLSEDASWVNGAVIPVDGGNRRQ